MAAVIATLIATRHIGGGSGGGGYYSPSEEPKRPWLLPVCVCVALLVLAAVLLVVIANQGPTYSVKAGYPAKVVNNWATGYGSNSKYYGPERWKPILVTHKVDCADCKTKEHVVHPNLYKTHQVGDDIWFQGDDFNSVVVEKRFSHGDYYATGYGLQLEVVQCIDGKGCVRGKVPVTLQTWMDFSEGDTITFGGKKGSSL